MSRDTSSILAHRDEWDRRGEGGYESKKNQFCKVNSQSFISDQDLPWLSSSRHLVSRILHSRDDALDPTVLLNGLALGTSTLIQAAQI